MSTSAPSIGLPLVSLNQASTNSAAPGVGERTIEVAIFGRRRIHAPERAEQVSVGFGLAAVAVVEEADQGRETERARHQHGFVVGLVGFLAERHDIGDGGLEFFLGQFHFAGKVMKMADQRGHDLAQARIFDARVFASAPPG